MRKIIATFLILSMLLSVLSVSNFAEDASVALTVSTDKTQVVRGDQVKVIVDVENPSEQPIGGINFTVNLPEGLEYVQHEVSETAKRFSMIVYNPANRSFFATGCTENNGLGLKEADWTALTITCMASDNLALGTVTVSITVNELYDGTTKVNYLTDANKRSSTTIQVSHAGDHQWSAWNIVTPATCKDGFQTRQCTIKGCTAKQEESIPADREHSYSPWTSDGKDTHSHECSVCGDKETKPHNWDNGAVTKPATHTETGVKTYTCTDCNATKTEEIPVLTEHSYGPWTSDGDDTHSRECECGDKETKPHNWDNGAVTKPATHTETGVKTYTCTDCKATKTEEIAKTTEHKYGPWTSDGDETHSRECVCGDKETKPHNWDSGVVTKPATHTETGVKTYTCADCKATKTEEIAKTTEHKYGPWTSDGDETHSRECVCGDKETKPHNWDNGAVTKPATHTETGVKTYTCTDCKATKTEKIPVTTEHSYGPWTSDGDDTHSRECTGGDDKQTEPHNWDNGAVTKPATHTETGVKTYTCIDCKATKTEEIPATTEHSYGPWTSDGDDTHSRECACGDKETKPHNWDNGAVTKPATHTETGVKTYTCTDCKATKTEEIPVTTEHSYGPWTSDGDDTHSRECTGGDDKQTEPHNWDNGAVTKEPTSTETGVKTYTCTDCKATKTEEIPVTEPGEPTEPDVPPTQAPDDSKPDIPPTGDRSATTLFGTFFLMTVLLAACVAVSLLLKKSRANR